MHNAYERFNLLGYQICSPNVTTQYLLLRQLLFTSHTLAKLPFHVRYAQNGRNSGTSPVV
jgi:hypothetical protein